MTDGSGDDILDRLEAIGAALKTSGDLATVAHNEPDIGSLPLPALVVFDGDEEGEGEPMRGKSAAARLLTLMPAVSIVVEGSASETRAKLRVLRRKYVKAVLTDEQLVAICGNSGGMIYSGYETDFVVAEKIIARMWLRFGFKYLFDPSSL